MAPISVLAATTTMCRWDGSIRGWESDGSWLVVEIRHDNRPTDRAKNPVALSRPITMTRCCHHPRDLTSAAQDLKCCIVWPCPPAVEAAQWVSESFQIFVGADGLRVVRP